MQVIENTVNNNINKERRNKLFFRLYPFLCRKELKIFWSKNKYFKKIAK